MLSLAWLHTQVFLVESRSHVGLSNLFFMTVLATESGSDGDDGRMLCCAKDTCFEHCRLCYYSHYCQSGCWSRRCEGGAERWAGGIKVETILISICCVCNKRLTKQTSIKRLNRGLQQQTGDLSQCSAGRNTPTPPPHL